MSMSKKRRAAESNPRPLPLSSVKPPETFAEMREVTNRFLRGELSESPSHMGPVDAETKPFVAPLIAITTMGLMTMCSQPGLDDGKGLRQRSFVIGLAEDTTADLLYEKINLAGLIAITHTIAFQTAPPKVGGASQLGSILVTMDSGKPYTHVGRYTFELGWWGKIMSIRSMVKLEEAGLREVILIDPVWGRDPMDEGGLFLAAMKILSRQI